MSRATTPTSTAMPLTSHPLMPKAKQRIITNQMGVVHPPHSIHSSFVDQFLGAALISSDKVSRFRDQKLKGQTVRVSNIKNSQHVSEQGFVFEADDDGQVTNKLPPKRVSLGKRAEITNDKPKAKSKKKNEVSEARAAKRERSLIREAGTKKRERA